MNKKIKKQSTGDRSKLVQRPNDAAALLSFLGLNAQLAAELKRFYEASLSEPAPKRISELLALLARLPNR